MWAPLEMSVIMSLYVGKSKHEVQMLELNIFQDFKARLLCIKFFLPFINDKKRTGALCKSLFREPFWIILCYFLKRLLLRPRHG